jgi:hypothetical protein
MELRVGGKFRLARKLGSGAFGDIYLGTLLYIITHRNKYQNKRRSSDKARTYNGFTLIGTFEI